MKAISVYELSPNNGRKSFYGKANVIITTGNIRFLRSYDTIMCGIDENGSVHRYSDHKSNTTCCHCKSFMGEFSYKGFWDLPLEKKPKITIEL